MPGINSRYSNWTAKDAAKLVSYPPAFGNSVYVILPGIGVQSGIAKLVVQGSMKLIGAGLRDNIDDPAHRVTKLRVITTALNFEFLNRIQIGCDRDINAGNGFHRVLGGIHTVKQERIVERARPA